VNPQPLAAWQAKVIALMGLNGSADAQRQLDAIAVEPFMSGRNALA
jgi:hypothetical protein